MNPSLRSTSEPVVRQPQGAGSLRHWIFQLLGLSLIVAALAYGVVQHNLFGKPPTVAAVLYVGPALGPGDAKDHKGTPREEVFRQTQASLLRTRPVLERALRKVADLNLSVVQAQSDPQAWLERELRIDTFANTSTIRVSLTGAPPNELAQLVNAVVHAYLEEFVSHE